MDDQSDQSRHEPGRRPPWEPASPQYEAMWHLDGRRETPRSRWLAVVVVAVVVLLAGAWAGYLVGSAEDGRDELSPPLPTAGTAASGGPSGALPSAAPEAATSLRLSTTVLEGGSDILATARARARPSPPGCPPGSTPDQAGSADQPRPDPAGSYGWRAAFHEPSGRMIMLDTSTPSDPRAWAFDVCRNAWLALDPPPAEVGYVDDLVYDADSGLMVVFGATIDPPWTWDVASSSWNHLGYRMGWNTVHEGSPRVYDPRSGLIVGRSDTGQLGAFDIDTATWSLVRQTGEVPVGYGIIVHDAVTDEIVLVQPVLLGTQGHRVAIWRFDPRSGRWTYDWSPSGEPLHVPWPPAIAHDAATGVIVIAGQTIEIAGLGARVTEVIGYEPGYIERMYLGTDDGIAHCTTRAIVFDSINGRVVCAGSVRYSFDPRGRLVGITDVTAVTAFDVARRTWVRLQEP